MKFQIETAQSESYTNAIWFSETIPEPVEAETEEEAIEIAKQYLIDCGASEAEVEETLYRAVIIND